MTMQIAELQIAERVLPRRTIAKKTASKSRRAGISQHNRQTGECGLPTEIEVVWSQAGWTDVSRSNGYLFPPAVDFLPGKDFVAQLTGLLENYLLEAQIILSKRGRSGAEIVAKLHKLTESSLDLAEKAVAASMGLSQDIHQYVHIHELSNNFLRTVTVLFDRLLGYPEQLSSVTRPKKETLQLHPELCGLLECAHILDVSSTHQGPRIPYAPHRTGREITYEEIANLYRTSRVNIRRLEVDKCRSKLKTKLKNYYL
jgi:hypothetical protein